MPARVGMIILPPFVPSDGEAGARFSNQVRDRLEELDPASCGWIVDLRRTSGGDPWPMLAGLGPLLGSGVVAYASGRDGEATPWAYQQGMFSEADTVVGSVFPPYELDQPDVPLAVLTGAGTRGAGEAVLVALRGRPNSRTFGETTGGPGVAVSAFTLSDGALLSLATSRYLDRSGRAYEGAIAPDVTMPGGGNPLNTQPIVAATAWMNSQPECRRR
jgi:C-terminal processing protease CtpA/Prc